MEQLEALEAAHASVVDVAVVVRALALLDQGLAAEARELLAGALAPARGAGFAPDDGADFERPEIGGFGRPPETGGFGRLGDAELESAFDDARPETDSMIDADGIAFEAILRARLDEPESVSLPAPDSPFHTRTMADLLERQGDAESAHAIRAALSGGDLHDALPARSLDAQTRARTIQTLERWLARLRGGDA